MNNSQTNDFVVVDNGLVHVSPNFLQVYFAKS